jgi:hypothetical protein
MEMEIIDLTQPAEPSEAQQYTALEALQRRCYRIADDHGFHDGDSHRQVDRVLMLMISELVEAFEFHRDGYGLAEWWYECRACKTRWPLETLDQRLAEGYRCCDAPEDLKPDGPAVELIDVLVRVSDTSVEFGIPTSEVLAAKLAYNESRPYRHNRQF